MVIHLKSRSFFLLQAKDFKLYSDDDESLSMVIVYPQLHLRPLMLTFLGACTLSLVWQLDLQFSLPSPCAFISHPQPLDCCNMTVLGRVDVSEMVLKALLVRDRTM